MMKVYKIGRVYKIINSVDDLIYVGATGDTLSRRMSGHKTKEKRGSSSPIYTHMRLLGVDKFSIILIEQLIDCNKEQLKAREDYFIKELDTVNNGLNGRYEDLGICSHNKDRRTCVPCKGSQVCIHSKIKQRCKECNGNKYKCVPCGKVYCCKFNLKEHNLDHHPN